MCVFFPFLLLPLAVGVCCNVEYFFIGGYLVALDMLTVLSALERLVFYLIPVVSPIRVEFSPL